MAVIPKRLVDLRPGEVPAFFRAFGVLLLTIAGHTLLETARDTLFLAQLPARWLTYVYVTVALGAVILAPWSSRLARAAGPRNALMVTLLLTALGAAWFRARTPSPAAAYALYVFGTLSATLLVGQFWTLSASLFSASQSRRLFGALASGGVLGAVLGAALAAVLLAHFEIRTLLAAATAAYFAGALVATTIELDLSHAGAEAPSVELKLDRVRHEPLVLRLAAITAVSAVLSVLIDYLFKSRVSASLSASQLGPFFARYQLFLNAGTLVLQLTLTTPLVERLGVVGLALLTPTLLTLGNAGALVSSGAFAMVVGLKAADAALRNSLGRVSMELLWAPVDHQARVRGVVDVVLARGAQAISGAALLGLSLRGVVSSLVLTGAALLFSVVWLALGMGIRTHYIELFRRAIGRGNLDRQLVLPELDLTAVETVVEALARPDPVEVIAAMNILAERGRVRLIPALVLYHDDPGVLERALELFGGTARKDWYPLGERLLEHAHVRVQNAAVRAFALSGATEILRRASQHASPGVRAFAELYRAQSEGRAISGDPLASPLFAADDPQRHPLKIAFIEALANNPTVDAVQTLLAFARLPALRGAVTRALGRVADASCVPFLIQQLAVVDDRLAARAALVRAGDPALQALIAGVSEPRLGRRVRLHVPGALADFKSEQAVAELLSILQGSSDGLIRYKALRALEQLARKTSLRIPIDPILQELQKNALEYLRLFALDHSLRELPAAASIELTLVLELIDDKLRQSLDRLVRLLQIAHRSDDIRAVFSALSATDRRLRGRAVEFLDALMRSLSRNSDPVATLLRLVVDDLPAGERASRAASLVGEIPNAAAALERLVEDADQVLRELSRLALQKVGVALTAPPVSLMTPGLEGAK